MLPEQIFVLGLGFGLITLAFAVPGIIQQMMIASRLERLLAAHRAQDEKARQAFVDVQNAQMRCFRATHD